jgi:cell division protein FtsB
MSTNRESRSRLCPKHRSDRIPTSSCVACAQARRIAELEQTVEQVVDRNERLTEHVKKLEADTADAEDTARESTPLPDGGNP